MPVAFFVRYRNVITDSPHRSIGVDDLGVADGGQDCGESKEDRWGKDRRVLPAWRIVVLNRDGHEPGR